MVPLFMEASMVPVGNWAHLLSAKRMLWILKNVVRMQVNMTALNELGAPSHGEEVWNYVQGISARCLQKLL